MWTRVPLLSCAGLARGPLLPQTGGVCAQPPHHSLPPAAHRAAAPGVFIKSCHSLNAFPLSYYAKKQLNQVLDFFCLSFHESIPPPMYAGMALWKSNPLNQRVGLLSWLCVSGAVRICSGSLGCSSCPRKADWCCRGTVT